MAYFNDILQLALFLLRLFEQKKIFDYIFLIFVIVSISFILEELCGYFSLLATSLTFFLYASTFASLFKRPLFSCVKCPSYATSTDSQFIVRQFINAELSRPLCTQMV